MKRILFAMVILAASSPLLASDNGVVSRASPYSSGETLNRLEAALKAKGMTIFAKVDHAEQARKAGLTMRPSQLVIFGNPVGGTPIMQAVPQAAIDLPLKALVWEDAKGKVWLSYNDPAWFQQRYKLSDATIKPLLGVPALMNAATK